MNLVEYRNELLEEVKISAEANTSDVYVEYLRYVVDTLQDIEEIEDFTECYFETVGKMNRKVNIT